MKLGEKLNATAKYIMIIMLTVLLTVLAVPVSVNADTHKLYFHRSPNNAGATTPISTNINVSSEPGAMTSFSATAFNGYTFWSWKCEWDSGVDYYYSPAVTVACSGLNNATVFFLKNSTTGIVAKVADSSIGSATGTRPWQWAYDGQYFTINAVPKDPTQYEFDYWECNGKKMAYGATAEVQMPKIHSSNVDWETGTCTGCQDVYTAHFKLKGSKHGFKAVVEDSKAGNITSGAFLEYSAWESQSTAAVAEAREGYEFVEWVDSSGNQVGTSKTLSIACPSGHPNDKDLVYTARFKKVSHAGISAKTMDEVTGDSGGGAVSPAYVMWSESNRSQAISFTASPDKGKEFKEWDVSELNVANYSGSLTNPTISVVMPYAKPGSDCVITAIFKDDTKYEVYTEVASEDGGIITPGHGGTVTPTMIEPNDTVQEMTLNAEPHTGYEFDHWEDLDSGGKIVFKTDTTKQKVTINVPKKTDMTQDIHLRAVFRQVTDAGIWAIALDGGEANPRFTKWTDTNKGSSFTISATPYSGYDFDHWEYYNGQTNMRIENYSTSPSLSVKMPDDEMTKDIFYTAVFRKKCLVYTEVASIEDGSISEGVGGTVSPAMVTPDEGNVTEVTLTATPDADYEFDHWEDVDSEGSISFITDTNHSTVSISISKQSEMPNHDVHIKAVFKPALDDGIWALALAGGTASPKYVKWSDSTKGTSFTITATPDAGYEFDHWKYHNKMNGMQIEEYSTASSLSVKMPEQKMTDDIFYTAVFTKNGEKTKNKKIHITGKKTGITDESFLNKWRTWIDPVLKYVRSTIENLAHIRTAGDINVYEGDRASKNYGGSVASDLKQKIDEANMLTHPQSVDNLFTINTDSFNVYEASGLRTVFTEGPGYISDAEAAGLIESKYGDLYSGGVVLAGDVHFENDKGDRITSELSYNDKDATVVIGGIETYGTDIWMLLYKDLEGNEHIITPITDASSMIRFTLPDKNGGKVVLLGINYK